MFSKFKQLFLSKFALNVFDVCCVKLIFVSGAIARGIRKEAAEQLVHFSKTKNKIIVFGGEANGIRDEILKNKGRKITINRFEKSKAESLNVAIANAIILSKL